MNTSHFIEQVLFVVVLYERLPEDSPSIQLLSTQPWPVSLYIYDNSHTPSPHPERSIYVHDPSNTGVAKAYNKAHSMAKKMGKKWMMLLDQDTALDKIFLDLLALETRLHPATTMFVPMLKDRRGLVSPFFWAGTSGRRILRVAKSLALSRCRFQNSGLLVMTDAFERAGGYDEQIALDFSDIAFGERMSKITDHFIVVNHTLLHPFSETEKVTRDSARHRYVRFCSGAFAMGRTSGDWWPFYFRALSRGLKLALRYRDPSFIKFFFSLREK